MESRKVMNHDKNFSLIPIAVQSLEFLPLIVLPKIRGVWENGKYNIRTKQMTKQISKDLQLDHQAQE